MAIIPPFITIILCFQKFRYHMGIIKHLLCSNDIDLLFINSMFLIHYIYIHNLLICTLKLY